MNANFSKLIVVMMLVSFAGASYAREPEPAVAVQTGGMPPHVAEKVKERAAEGVTPLRRYVWITRSMHGLDLRSIVRAEPTSIVLNAKKSTQIAEKSQ